MIKNCYIFNRWVRYAKIKQKKIEYIENFSHILNVEFIVISDLFNDYHYLVG